VAQVMAFPKELERHMFRDLDRDFFIITVFCLIFMISFFSFMSGKEFAALSADEIKRYTEIIYRVPVRTTPIVATESATVGGDESEELAEDTKAEVPEIEEVEAVEEVAEFASEESKRDNRQQKRQKRSNTQERRREKVRAAAERMKILAGPTSSGGRKTRGGTASAEALGLSSGSVEGYDVKKMVGIVGDSDTRSKVKKARGGGAVSDDASDIDIGELKKLSIEEGDMMFKQTSVDLNRSTITARGRGSKVKQRSQSAISEIVMKNKNQVQYCYWTLKRRDSSLRGRVPVEFTINPAGEVIKVRFRRTDWYGNKLGAEVERCIKNVISSWRFDEIDPKAGNVTAGATYVFE